MKLPLTLALVSCVAASNLLAAENITRNGVTWNGTFEGDVFPSASTPVWSIYANSGSWTANNNIPGIFTQDTFVGSAGAWQVSTGFNDPLSTKRTVEAKLKVGSNANYPNAAGGAVTLLVFGGNRYMVFYIGTNSISMAGTSTASASVDMLSNFNTLRVTHDSTRSTDAWKLYLNSNATPIISSGSDPGVWQGSPYYAVVFGDPTTGGIGGESQWDYISWTDAGAFAPSPAPSSYAAWAQGAPLDATNQLLYAIGGASSPAATDWVAPVTSISSGMLSTAAIVRTNDPSLTVYGQSSLDLSTGAWMTNDVSMNPSVDQAGVPAGMQRQIFSTPRTPDETKKFLRLQMTLQP